MILKKIQLAYRSKNNLTCNKHVIFLMITDGEKMALFSSIIKRNNIYS